MANNIISDWLETYALYSDTPEQEAATRYAAQLNRLVEAANKLHDHNALCPCSEMDEVWDELNAALRDIELESEARHE